MPHREGLIVHYPATWGFVGHFVQRPLENYQENTLYPAGDRLSSYAMLIVGTGATQ